ncbi:hypothetical protein NEOC95_000439 [Neochlamydia sp. AcF95]|nr:hypothetical protein [Neochlamydia sp. AcF95]
MPDQYSTFISTLELFFIFQKAHLLAYRSYLK